MRVVYNGLSACTRDNTRAKARGLSPRTGGQTTVELLLKKGLAFILSDFRLTAGSH